MRKYIALTLLLILLINQNICTYAENITELQEQSNDITQNLVETNNKLQAVKDELSENMKLLQELDSKIVETESEIDTINKDINELNIQIDENEQKLQKVQKEYADIQELLDARLIQMYETPKLGFLQVIFQARNITEFLASYYAMKELAEYDKELLEKVRNQKKEIEITKKVLDEKKNQVIKNKQTQKRKAQVLENSKTQREYYISKLSTEEKQLQNQIDEYNAQVATIEAEIRLLALNSISEEYIGGAMIWPIPGYSQVTSKFGMRVHPITGTYKLHTGMDVGAPIGASFVSAANGIVSKATYNTAYGNMVIIDHGGGVQTLYAHGSEIMVQVGQIVKSGDEVLKVGTTGYSTGAHAHFEIRVNGQTVDPEKFLVPNKADTENR